MSEKKSKYIVVHLAFFCKENGAYFVEGDVKHYEEIFRNLFVEDNVIAPLIKVGLGKSKEVNDD